MEPLEDRTVPAWIGQVGGPGEEIPVGRPFMDAAGNAYVTGYFNQTVDFDPGPGTWNLTSAGGQDAFLAKYSRYDPSGQPLPGGALRLLWARGFGGTLAENVGSSCVDPSDGSVYVTGTFQGSADFTGDGVADLTSAGDEDAFVVKLDPTSGTTLWARGIGGGWRDRGNDIAAAGGTVYVTGMFTGTVDFDPGPATHSLTSASRSADVFVLTLDGAGNYASAWQVGGKETETAGSLLLDGGSLYLLGSFGSGCDFDPRPTVTVSRNTTGGKFDGGDIFFARYTTAGALTWVQTIGSRNTEFATNPFRLGADATGLYVTGSFYGAFDFDPGPGVYSFDAGAAQYFDGVVARYTKANGSLVWARQIGEPAANEQANYVLVNPASGALYVDGRFGNTVDFDPGPGTANLTSAGSSDAFLLKLDASGNYLNAWRMGGADYDSAAYPIGVVGGTVYATGRFSLTADFPTGGTLTSNGSTDVFLMALDDTASAPQPATGPSAAAAAALSPARALPAPTAGAAYRYSPALDEVAASLLLDQLSRRK